MRARRDGQRADGEQIRLLGPDLGAVPPVLDTAQLDAAQATALETFLAGRSMIVHAAPGAGRTALALCAAAQARARGEDTLLVAPRRRNAGMLRDALGAAGEGGVSVMTPSALGFSICRTAARRRGAPEPTLVTGAEQDALLGELIALREDWYLSTDPAARALPGFRTELRDLLTRAAELGLTPSDLEQLGRDRGRPAWVDAAAIQRDYLGVLDLEAASALDAGERLDSGALLRRAVGHLASDPLSPPPARAVIIDDAQDLTAAGVELLLALADAGARLLVLSSPDTAVDTFRGALPDAAARLRERLTGSPGGQQGGPQEMLLESSRAQQDGPAAVVDALRGRLPLAGAPARSRRPRTGAPGGLAVLRARDALDEARLIGSVLRDLHHGQGIPLDDMAVVCRSGAAVADVAELLARTGLRVHVPHRPQPLRDVAVIADLLTILELGQAEEGARPDPATATALLRGPFGDADALRLRRIRRLLLSAHRDRAAAADPAPGDGPENGPGSEELLARALVDDEVPGLPDPAERDRAAAPVHRVRAMLRAAREHRDEPAEQVLWHTWDAARLATGWRHAALGDAADADGARARLAAGRLDALLELFAAAERLTDRRPGAGAGELIEQIRAQAVVEDTLAAATPARGRVAVLTPAQLAGEHRDTVVLARVQEGAWPDLRLRSTLFGATELSLIAGVRGEQEVPENIEALRALQRQQVLADELRLALSALSRARCRVLITAVEDEHGEPSALVEVLERIAADPAAAPPWVGEDDLRADPGPAPDVRRLVAALRTRLHGDDPDAAADAARALAQLGRSGASGTDPAHWYHQPPSSVEPLQDAGTAPTLSPSALERAAACPRAWLFERSGGTRAGSPAPLIGTALHLLAQRHPAGVPDTEQAHTDLLGELHSLLRAVPGSVTWSGRRRIRHAEDAALLLAEHLRGAGQPRAIEAPFTLELGPVHLRGTIDRIEGDETGLRVVDLKTGRSPKTAAQAEEDLQLAAYQAAVRDGALDEQLGAGAGERLNGAQLVYVGTGTRRAAVRTQGALTRAEDPTWFDTVVTEVAREVSGPTVTARRNPHCSRCAVRSSCPLQDEGEQL